MPARCIESEQEGARRRQDKGDEGHPQGPPMPCKGTMRNPTHSQAHAPVRHRMHGPHTRAGRLAYLDALYYVRGQQQQQGPVALDGGVQVLRVQGVVSAQDGGMKGVGAGMSYASM